MWSKYCSQNVGRADRTIRLALALALIPLGLFALDSVDASLAGVIVTTVGLIGLVTGATGRCPTYGLLRISTVRGLHRVRPSIAIGTTPHVEHVLVSAESTRGD